MTIAISPVIRATVFPFFPHVEKKKREMTSRRECFPDYGWEFFYALCRGTPDLLGAGTGAGFNTVTTGPSSSGHTGTQILCLGLKEVDLHQPTSASRHTTDVMFRFPVHSVRAAHFPLGIQSIVRPLVSIPEIFYRPVDPSARFHLVGSSPRPTLHH